MTHNIKLDHSDFVAAITLFNPKAGLGNRHNPKYVLFISLHVGQTFDSYLFFSRKKRIKKRKEKLA